MGIKIYRISSLLIWRKFNLFEKISHFLRFTFPPTWKIEVVINRTKLIKIVNIHLIYFFTFARFTHILLAFKNRTILVFFMRFIKMKFSLLSFFFSLFSPFTLKNVEIKELLERDHNEGWWDEKRRIQGGMDSSVLIFI